MVQLFTNCNGCANRPGCQIKEEFDIFAHSVRISSERESSDLQAAINVKISCNRYQTDYGKGGGL